jgi:oxygen-independent coproporphyrinogen-3 oxidase
MEKSLDTLYIGGGTPTVLQEGRLERLIHELLSRLEMSEGAEITVEANPGTLSTERMRNLKSLGVGRISLGVQSLNDIELQELGRIHSAQEARDAIVALLELDYSVSTDLMCNIPRQTAHSFSASLGELLALPINHLSIYDLKIEKQTPFYSMHEKGKLALPIEQEANAIEDIKNLMIDESLFSRYEISNYAKPGFHSRHNTVYWKNQAYLGIGVAAASRFGNIRRTNGASLEEYISTDSQESPFYVTNEKINEKMEREETVFLGLRLTEGLNLSDFELRHGSAFEFFYGAQIEQIVGLGLGAFADGYFRLTNKGLDFSNHVLSLFV